jgi:hypothetical protein
MLCLINKYENISEEIPKTNDKVENCITVHSGHYEGEEKHFPVFNTTV